MTSVTSTASMTSTASFYQKNYSSWWFDHPWHQNYQYWSISVDWIIKNHSSFTDFSTFSVEGCWGQPMLLFWKLIHKTQMSNPPEAASYRNSTKLLILLPLRVIYFYSLYRVALRHGLRTPREEIAFTARPKIHSHSQIFRYAGSIFCLPHRPIFSDIFDLCLHWVSVVRVVIYESQVKIHILWEGHKIWRKNLHLFLTLLNPNTFAHVNPIKQFSGKLFSWYIIYDSFSTFALNSSNRFDKNFVITYQKCSNSWMFFVSFISCNFQDFKS
jgi:hypothetical protein